MTLYFSKNNIFSFIKLFRDHEKGQPKIGYERYLYESVIQLVCDNSKRFFCFNHEDLTESEEIEFEYLLDRLVENQDTKCETKFGVSYKSYIDEMDIYEIMSMYFISDDDNILNLGHNKLIICCEEIGKEFETFEKIFIKVGNLLDNNFEFNINKESEYGKEKYWKYRLDSIEYLTDVFVDDAYIFKDYERGDYNEGHEQKNLIIENITCILSNIINNSLTEKVNIVIRTSVKDKRSTEYDDDIRRKITKKLRGLFKNKGINLTIISNWSYSKDISIDLHDREIMTNYDFFTCGIGFKIFNNHDAYGLWNKNPNKPPKPHGNHRQWVNKFRLNTQKIRLDDIKDLNKGISENDKLIIFGPKKSNFVNFPSD